MTTLEQIRREPERLGWPVDDEDVLLFTSAVEVLMERGVPEDEAIDQVWGDGDWLARAIDLVPAFEGYTLGQGGR